MMTIMAITIFVIEKESEWAGKTGRWLKRKQNSAKSSTGHVGGGRKPLPGRGAQQRLWWEPRSGGEKPCAPVIWRSLLPDLPWGWNLRLRRVKARPRKIRL